MGTDFWMGTLPFDLMGYTDVRPGQIVNIMFFLLEIPAVAMFLFSNLQQHKNSDHFKERYDPWTFVQHILFMPILVGVWHEYQFSPNSKANTDYYILMHLAYSAQFMQAIHRLMTLCSYTMR